MLLIRNEMRALIVRKTLIAELVLQYIQENVKTIPTPIEVFSGARLGGNYSRANLLSGNFRGLSLTEDNQ